MIILLMKTLTLDFEVESLTFNFQGVFSFYILFITKWISKAVNKYTTSCDG